MNTESKERKVSLLDAAVELMGRSGRNGTLRVQGKSMIPTLLQGQTMLAEFSAEKLRRGDLVLFRQEDYLVVHRLVGPARKSGSLVTRGDGVLDLDPPVEVHNVLGRVIAVEDDGGWWDLQTRGARVYGFCLAWHGRVWHNLGRLGGLADRVFAKLRLRSRFRGIAWYGDRLAVRLTHRWWFHRLHRRTQPN